MRKQRATLIKLKNGRHRVATPSEKKLLLLTKLREDTIRKLSDTLRHRDERFEDQLNDILKGDLQYALPEATRTMMIEKLIAEDAEKFGRQIGEAANRAIKSYGKAFAFDIRSVERPRVGRITNDIVISADIQPFRCYIGYTR